MFASNWRILFICISSCNNKNNNDDEECDEDDVDDDTTPIYNLNPSRFAA